MQFVPAYGLSCPLERRSRCLRAGRHLPLPSSPSRLTCFRVVSWMGPLPTILYLRRRVWQTLSLDELFLVGAIQRAFVRAAALTLGTCNRTDYRRSCEIIYQDPRRSDRIIFICVLPESSRLYQKSRRSEPLRERPPVNRGGVRQRIRDVPRLGDCYVC
jgi:hypothetical protein